MNKIFYTSKLVYTDFRIFKRYYKYFLEKPESAMCVDHAMHKITCEDLSKPLFFMFYSHFAKNVEISKLEKIFDLIVYEYIGREYP